MQDEVRNCGCNNGCSCNNGGFLGNLFGGCGDNCEMLFFILVFLLLFTNFGGRSGNNCGCGC